MASPSTYSKRRTILAAIGIITTRTACPPVTRASISTRPNGDWPLKIIRCRPIGRTIRTTPNCSNISMTMSIISICGGTSGSTHVSTRQSGNLVAAGPSRSPPERCGIMMRWQCATGIIGRHTSPHIRAILRGRKSTPTTIAVRLNPSIVLANGCWWSAWAIARWTLPLNSLSGQLRRSFLSRPGAGSGFFQNIIRANRSTKTQRPLGCPNGYARKSGKS